MTLRFDKGGSIHATFPYLIKLWMNAVTNQSKGKPALFLPKFFSTRGAHPQLFGGYW